MLDTIIDTIIAFIVHNAWPIGLIGLSISFAGGVLLIFSYSKYPGPGASYTTRKGSLMYIDYHLSPLRSRIGAILLATGFLLQIVCYVAPKFNLPEKETIQEPVKKDSGSTQESQPPPPNGIP